MLFLKHARCCRPRFLTRIAAATLVTRRHIGGGRKLLDGTPSTGRLVDRRQGQRIQRCGRTLKTAVRLCSSGSSRQNLSAKSSPRPCHTRLGCSSECLNMHNAHWPLPQHATEHQELSFNAHGSIRSEPIMFFLSLSLLQRMLVLPPFRSRSAAAFRCLGDTGKYTRKNTRHHGAL